MKRCCGSVNDSFSVMSELTKKMSQHKDRDINTLITVGVVFHICYANPNTSVIPNDVTWTLAKLNQDYNGTPDNLNQFDSTYVNNTTFQNTYNDYKSRKGNMNVNFVLSQIIYVSRPTQSSSNISVLDTNIKSYSQAINPEQLLNVWVADLNSGLLGYAQFPWEFNNNTKKYDGVLIAKGAFGPSAQYSEFNLNRTLTHEVGHWFGLYHTFQNTFSYDGGNIDYAPGTNAEEMKGDCVIDTPPQSTATYGNPFLTPTSWPTSKPSDESQSYKAMFMNFMDYVDDVAMFIFTSDQTSKMRQMVSLYRPQILGSTPPPPTPTPPPITSPYYRCNFDQYNDFNTWTKSSSTNVNIVKSVSSGNNTNVLQITNTANVQKNVNLTGATSAKLVFSYLTNSPTANLLYKSPSASNWTTAKLTTGTSSYKTSTINISGPFTGNLQIKFETKSTSKYLRIDNISVTN